MSRSGCRRDAVPDVPQIFVEPVLHALLEDFHWCPHRSHHAPANDPLGQLQMMKTKQLHALVEIEQPFGDIVQAEKFFVTPIDVIHSESGLLDLLIECLTESRTGVQQRQESWRVEPAAMPKPGANQMAVRG